MESIVCFGPCEDAVLITSNGELVGIWTRGTKDIYLHADALQELMIEVMKDRDHNLGLWIWTLMRNCKVIIGRNIKDG